MNSKFIPSRKLPSLIRSLRKKKKKIVFTNGCFDLLHPGHIKLLEFARAKADILILGLNSDVSTRKMKGPHRPLLEQPSRVAILSAISFIDYIAVFNQATPLELIKKIRPDVLVKGADWKKDDIVGSKFVEAYGGKVLRVKLKKGFSTTSLIRKIKKF